MQKTSIKQKIILYLFSIFLSFAILEVGLRVGGFMMLTIQERRNNRSIEKKGTYRILCLGESTTANGGEYSYPRQLEIILNQQNTGVNFSVINKGIWGTNSFAILANLEDNLIRYDPDMVITMMGVNDDEYIREEYIFKKNEDSSSKEIMLFLKSFRTYQFVKLLNLHAVNKVKKLVFLNKKEKRENDFEKMISFEAQVKNFKEKIKKNAYNDQLYLELGKLLLFEGRFKKAGKIFQKAIKLNHENYMTYLDLIWTYYEDQGELIQANKVLQGALAMNPENDLAYVHLGQFYSEVLRKYDKAEEILRKAIEINPNNDTVFTGLGKNFMAQREYDQAGKVFQKALAINPKSDGAYVELGRYYWLQEEFLKAEEMLDKAVELDSGNSVEYVEIIECCFRQKGFDTAEKLLKKAIVMNPQDAEAYDILAYVYDEQDETELVSENTEKANAIRAAYDNSLTRNNYHRLKEILAQKGIRKVFVQYPMRSVEMLKGMFKGREDIIFVDNEHIFKEAVIREGYDEYFTDRFAGDFGHCTAKGNYLLAKNIMNTILNEMF